MCIVNNTHQLQMFNFQKVCAPRSYNAFEFSLFITNIAYSLERAYRCLLYNDEATLSQYVARVFVTEKEKIYSQP